MLVVFYDTELADPREISRALQVAVSASRIVSGYEFFKCDTASSTNQKLADESKLRGGVYIFSRTVDDGIDEYRLPLETEHLVRYLHLRGVVGSPDDVRLFTTREDLHALLDPLSPGGGKPVFLRFHEPWCSHCFRMRQAWEATATLLRNQVHVVDVDCSRHKPFCDEQGVDSYPLLRILAVGSAPKDESTELPIGGAWVSEALLDLPSGMRLYRGDWNGSRSVAALEWAVQLHTGAAGGAVKGPAEEEVLSVFGMRGRPPTLVLKDYSSMPPSPRDNDSAQLAAAVGGAGAQWSSSQAEVDVSGEVHAAATPTTTTTTATKGRDEETDEEEEEEEDELWAAYGQESDADQPALVL